MPLHPQLVDFMKSIRDGKEDSELIFKEESFRKWLQTWKIPLSRCNSHFFASDLRKFAEQHDDVIGWNESNRAYVLTHSVRGIEWSNYRHPLSEHVYDVYMEAWRDVNVTT